MSGVRAVDVVSHVARGVARERGWELGHVGLDPSTDAVRVMFALPNDRWFRVLVTMHEVLCHRAGPRAALVSKMRGKDLGGPFEREAQG